jgi:hypothetical protein
MSDTFKNTKVDKPKKKGEFRKTLGPKDKKVSPYRGQGK